MAESLRARAISRKNLEEGKTGMKRLRGKSAGMCLFTGAVKVPSTIPVGLHAFPIAVPGNARIHTAHAARNGARTIGKRFFRSGRLDLDSLREAGDCIPLVIHDRSTVRRNLEHKHIRPPGGRWLGMGLGRRSVCFGGGRRFLLASPQKEEDEQSGEKVSGHGRMVLPS